MTTNRLFLKVKPIWDSYLSHDFIKGIEDGSLDKEKFKFYQIQDYIYLLDYAKVFAFGIVKAKDERLMRIFSRHISAIIDTEAETHRDYFKEFGITNASDYNASLTTESYTKYMLAVASTEGVCEILTAVLACSWSYKYIADNLDKTKDFGFYKDWVEMYASEGYAKTNDEIISLVDELSKDYTEEQLQNLEKIIENCSRYEYMFWDMAYDMVM